MVHRARSDMPRGYALLHDPLLNKGSAFPIDEREALGLHGLLPPHVFTLEEQVRRAMQNYARKPTDLERYIYLVSLQDRNETLFHRVLVDHLEEMMPIVYTPTVGEACQHFAEIFRRPRGVYVTCDDRGRVPEILRNVSRVRGRERLTPEKQRYAHEHAPIRDFAEAVRALRPTAIVGVAAIRGAFGPDVLQAMAQVNERPIVFALSNPTSRSECTAEEAYRGTAGRAIFASGSPFAPLEWDGKRLVPGQGNNSYVFPGVGLAVAATEARHVSERMFSAAARALAATVTGGDLAMGRVYPALARIREVSAQVAAAVAEVAHAEGLARAPRPPDLLEHVRASMWEPRYESLLA